MIRLALRPLQTAALARTACVRQTAARPTLAASFRTNAILLRSLPAGWSRGKAVSYDEIKPITEQPSDVSHNESQSETERGPKDVLLIDVREPDEVMQGNIPSSVNLPLSIFEQEIGTDTGDFTRKNGFRKPAKDQPIVVYCKSGKRSQTALEALERHGYKHVRNYTGSYSDWSKRESQQN